MNNFLRPASKVDQQTTKARECLAKKQYREAINAYKELLKSSPDQTLQRELAEAYRGRVHELVLKGMYPEALVLWENQARLTGESPWNTDYVSWLFKAGQYTKLADQVDTLTAMLEPLGLARPVLEMLAILALDDSKLLARFAPGHAIARHQPIMLEAFKAYSSGQSGTAESCLQQIPSRSPYREVRTLLKGLLLLEQDRAAGLDFLDGIASDSVIRPLAEHLKQQATARGVDAQTYVMLPGKLQTLIGKLNGYGKQQLDLLRSFRKLSPDCPDRALFEFALTHRQALGEAVVYRFCKMLLVDYPEGLKLFERNFGGLPELELIRLQALMDESRGNGADAANTWREYLLRLKALPDRSDDQANLKQVEAFVFRHCFELAGESPTPGLLKMLARSLELDPEDRQSFIHLIEGYQVSDPGESQVWLTKALQVFPRDLDFLTRAMYAAAEREAFKKAASYARTILDIDSLNTVARLFLTEAHLGHARKQFKAGRPDLALQEITKAQDLDTNERNSQPFYLQGIILGRSRQVEASITQISKGFAIDQQNPLVAQLGYLVEINSLGVSKRSKETDALSPCPPKYQPSRDDMNRLLEKARRVPKAQAAALLKALHTMSSLIVRGGSSLDVSEGEYRGWCGFLLDLEAYDLLNRFCRNLCKGYRFQWPPLLALYSTLARCEGDLTQLGMIEGMQFNILRMQIQSEGDQEALKLVNRYMGRVVAEVHSLMQEDDEEEDEEEDDDESFDPLEYDREDRVEFFLEDMNEISEMTDKDLKAYINDTLGKKLPRNLNRDQMIDMVMDYLLQRYKVTMRDVRNAMDST